jgi:hypothetical protein
MEKRNEAKLQVGFDGRQAKALNPDPNVPIFSSQQALHNQCGQRRAQAAPSMIGIDNQVGQLHPS